MSRQGIQTAINKMHKTSYKGLTIIEKQFVKLNETLDGLNKSIDYCFKKAHKNENGGVDWDEFEEKDKPNYELFQFCFTKRDKIEKKIHNLIEKYNLNEKEILHEFMVLQRRSYGGSF